MHIAEGVLSGPVLIGGWALTISATAVALKKMQPEKVMTVAVLASAFFIASLVNVPLGPASVHLVLNGLLGLVLGWACFPAILCGLLLQSVFFQYGGLSSLGVNTFNMAAPALFIGLTMRPLLLRGARTRAVVGFAAGFCSVLLAGALTALGLGLSDQGFMTAARLIFLAHLPVMVIEGIITLFAVTFLARVQPEILNLPPESSHATT